MMGPGLERRVHRFVRHLGYTARRNIVVLTEQNVTVAELDLIGVKFDDTLRPDFVLIETSGGQKNFEDLLKLTSLSTFLPRCSIYYVGGNVSTDVVRFAEKVGIRAMHTSRLDEIESEMGIKTKNYAGSCSEGFDALTEKFSSLLYDRRYGDPWRARFSFWLETDPFLKLKRTRSLLRKLAKDMQTVEDHSLRPAIEFLAAEVVLLYTIAILEAAGEMFVLPDHQREVIFKERLVAGRISIREKDALLGRFYRFLEDYTKQLQRPMKIRREDFKLTDPDAGYLYDIVSRILKQAPSSKAIPQVLDVVLTTTLLGSTGKMELVAGFGRELPDLDFALKLTRDIVLPIFSSAQPAFVKKIAAIQSSDFVPQEFPRPIGGKFTLSSDSG